MAEPSQTEIDDLGPDSGYEEFLKSFLPPDQQPKKPAASEGQPEEPAQEQPKDEPETTEETSDESPEETTEDEGTAEEKEEKRKYADDGVFVKIKVGDKDHEVSVKDLQRLYGQEAALTQKSQQVADQRKAIEAEVAKNTAATKALLDRAKTRFEPYAKIDFNLAAQKLSPEEYTALRNEAMKAYEDVQFLEHSLDAHMQEINTTQQNTLRERAQSTLKELSDPEKGIEGWNEGLYNELRSYAVANFGVPQDVMNNLVDAWGIRILHKAMLYDRGVKNKVTVTKVNKTPKKVVKTTNSPDTAKSGAGSQNDVAKAMARLKKSGTEEDAEAAFLARWADND